MITFHNPLINKNLMYTLASKFGAKVYFILLVWSLRLMYTLASKFGANVYFILQVWSLGLMYTLASKFGANVYFILQYKIATTYIKERTRFYANLRSEFYQNLKILRCPPLTINTVSASHDQQSK